MKVKKRLIIRILPLVLAIIVSATVIPAASATISAQDLDPLSSAFIKPISMGSPVTFSPEDFTSRISDGLELEGILITSLPNESAGTLYFGNHLMMAGEAVETQSLGSLRFIPSTSAVLDTSFSFIPIFTTGVASESLTVSLTVTNKTNRPPIAENIELVTYKNIAVTGQFKATDPDGDMLSFKIISKPKRGEITLPSGDPASFKYTPYQNKTGTETLEYIAIDAFGNSSEPAKITININNPSTKTTYSDMDGHPAHYAALRLIEENVFVGENMGGKYFFNPDQTVSRGEFVAMAVNAMGLADDLNATTRTGFADDDMTPDWVKPYALTALKNGIIRGVAIQDGRKVFRSDYILTRGEAAVIINNALSIADVNTAETFADDDAIPVWAYQAVMNVSTTGIMNSFNDGTIRLMEPVTRAQAAEMLCNAIELKKASEPAGGFFSWLF